MCYELSGRGWLDEGGFEGPSQSEAGLNFEAEILGEPWLVVDFIELDAGADENHGGWRELDQLLGKVRKAMSISSLSKMPQERKAIEDELEIGERVMG